MKLSYKYNDKTFREFCQIKFGYCSLVVSNITSLEIRQRKTLMLIDIFIPKPNSLHSVICGDNGKSNLGEVLQKSTD